MAAVDRDLVKTHFQSFDKDGDGSITVSEVSAVIKSIGQTASEAEIKKLIKEVDSDQDGTINFEEFCALFSKLKTGAVSSTSGFGQIVSKNAQVNVVSSVHGTHSFSEEEKVSFVEHINDCLGNDPDLKHVLPIPVEGTKLFDAVKDGILLNKLINASVANTVDVRVINKGANLNAFKITENLNLAINSAKGIGCTVVNVGSVDIQEGKPHIILGLVWQIIKIGLMANITLANHPELFRLLEPGETIDDLLKLSPEQILLRWFNYHLKKAGSSKKVTNFSGDIKDSEAYTILLNQLAPEKCDKKALNESDLTTRAKMVLDNAEKLDCKKFVKPKDITQGNAKLNLAFVANLFNKWPGLEALTEAEKLALDEWLFASEGTREARVFCLWINSLGIEPFVVNLFNDLQDGIVILKVMDIVKPGIVDWNKVNQKHPLNKFKKLENCNYAITLGKSKDLNFSLVGISGDNIVDGNKTLTLALVWQLMRAHVLSILASLGSNVDENKMVSWANERVKGSGESIRMESLKDPSLKTSHFFLHLLNTIRKCVDFDLVTEGKTDEDAMQNAKYTISVARKLGCTIFLLPEDIVEVKQKMLLTLLGSIMAVALKEK